MLHVVRRIQYFDTAQAYGVSEIVLGSNWPFNANPKVISKIKPCSSPNDWDQNFYETLSHLKLDYLDALLVHRASDLYSTDGTRLLDWLERLREQGRVGRIGVSIYDSSELTNLDLDRIQLVQLPLSIYDQRFLVDGTLEMLRERGISVHARSVFLQGLILRGSDEWPKFLSDEFLLHHSTFMQSLASLQLSPLELALGFVRSCHDVEAVLVGVLSSDELLEVISAWSSNVYVDLIFTLLWA